MTPERIAELKATCQLLFERNTAALKLSPRGITPEIVDAVLTPMGQAAEALPEALAEIERLREMLAWIADITFDNEAGAAARDALNPSSLDRPADVGGPLPAGGDPTAARRPFPEEQS